jgi:hypothetical protein
MYVLGIISVQGRFRWALVKSGKKITLEREEESSVIPPEILSIKELRIVTGLEGACTLRRDLTLPLTSLRVIRKALAFQLEPLLPFNLDQAIIYPQLHTCKTKTWVAAWATTHPTVESHLEKWNSFGIDPDLVSSDKIALSRWASYFFPDEPQLVIINNSLAIVLDQGRVVCAMESPDPNRLRLFLKQKYPLFKWIDQEQPFAVPIGLALEAFQKRPCQFRTSYSLRQKSRQRSLAKKIVTASLCLTTAVALFAITIFHSQEKKLKNQIARFYKPVTSIEESVDRFRRQLLQEAKLHPPTLNHPSVQEVLSWLSAFTAPVDIVHLEYELKTPARLQLSLDFQAKTPHDADQFVKQLQQTPTFVEPTCELKWTSHAQGYKLSFYLRSL